MHTNGQTIQTTPVASPLLEQAAPLWRSLDELIDDPSFKKNLVREFPVDASTWNDPFTRRKFLSLMGASIALASVSGCGTQPAHKIVPYTQAPEEVIPGKPLYYATATTLGGLATGVLVACNMGRPTKVEGNELHPASLGATDALTQAAILSLYDPDRSQNVLHAGTIGTWGDFLNDLSVQLDAQRAKRGAGLRLLTETIASPTLFSQIEALLGAFPEAKWHQYEPVNRDNSREGALLAFGEDASVLYKFENADVVVSLGADFLGPGPGHLAYARNFSNKRKVRHDHPEMNRLYVLESTPTITGANADHRLPLSPSDLEAFAFLLARELGIDSGTPAQSAEGSNKIWIAALARDLQAHPGSSLVLAGDSQPPRVHAIAHLINEKLGNTGKTVFFTDPLEARAVNQIESLTELVNDMRAGSVDTLVMLGGNPVYNAPADLRFSDALNRVAYRVHLSLYDDETSRLCHWHIPQTHEFEAWSDARAFDGSLSILQPLIMPLYGGKSPHELMQALIAPSSDGSYEIVREYWRKFSQGDDFEPAWRRAVHDGILRDSALPYRTLHARPVQPAAVTQRTEGLTVIFQADAAMWDGRFANNAWLQEWPRPLTRLTWDNAAFISADTAAKLNLKHGQMVELSIGEHSVRAPVWIMPGQAGDTLALPLGYGRTRSGRAGNGIGFDAYALRHSKAMWTAGNIALKPLAETHVFATTQSHHSMEGRDLVHATTLADYKEATRSTERHEEEASSLLSPVPNQGHAWGMLIDLTACVGCGACVLACQSENNIPVVGREEVQRGREMHWLRIDRYYEGTPENPRTYFEPMACVHCETAPCEIVCPVAATVHSSEGLNQMVYNRCVGTRYCSNNCPYKVRRFNFLQYSEIDSAPMMLMKNPDVTVRERGVMEKCTYCIQRINAARIEAEKENRPLRDGEITTACQGACPSEAIVFGDINDPNSRVAKLKREPHNFGVLADLNTHPRTTYLPRIRNPNPELPD
jgi:molybdopterin-containing oxidoreductase family iron-sulfur binding subunit